MYFDPSFPVIPRPTATHRVLAVVDWTVDPDAVVASLRRHARVRESSFGLVVPAWLHGLDWVGDPTAAVPCAERQLSAIARLAGATGLSIDAAAVRDPDPITATLDGLGAWPAEEIILCTRPRHFAMPPLLGLVSRMERATGLPVARLPVSGQVSSHHREARRRSVRCAGVRPGRLRTLSE